jgi:hypothetical protein
VTVGTLFHHSRIPLGKWFAAVSLMEESGRDPSNRKLAALIGVNKNSACYMAMRIRKARVKESALLWSIREEMKK